MMRVDELLARLDHVRRKGDGWMARCPAHEDRNPSLSVSEGERGLLVKCWAGCTVGAITAALGVRVSDLFYDQRPNPTAIRQRTQERIRREHAHVVRGLETDSIREAERFIASAKNMEITDWSDAQLDRALNMLADAYAVIERERRRDHAA
jgi:hypothetical protein